MLEYFESTRCIVTRAYPWSTLSTIRNQPRCTGGGSCTCRANGSMAELRDYTRCHIEIEHRYHLQKPFHLAYILLQLFHLWYLLKFLSITIFRSVYLRVRDTQISISSASK